MSETRDLIDMHYAAFNERDFSKTSQIYSPDVVTIEPGSGRMEGPDAVDNIPAGLENLPLITPRDPPTSIFLQLIVPDDGPMISRFTAEEIQVIERWIMSL